MRSEETATAATLATQVFDEFVSPYYRQEGVDAFHSYAHPRALDTRNKADHLTLVADGAGQIIGMLQLRDFRHVCMLFVHRERQRGGVARGLLAKAIALCRCQPSTPDALTVRASPNAVEAYARWGFSQTGPAACEGGIVSVPMRLPL